MTKGIWAGLVAIAFVAGSIMTGTMAYAASNAQGQPFQQIQQQIDDLVDSIPSAADLQDEILNSILTTSNPLKDAIDQIREDLDSHTVADQDHSPTNELQTLSLNPDTNELSISEGNSVFIPEIDDEVLVGFAKLDEDNRFIGANEFHGVSFTPGAVTFQGVPVDFDGTEASFLSICIDDDCRTEWPAASAFPNTYTRTGLPVFCDPNDKVLGGGPVNSDPQTFVQNSGPTGIGTVLEGWQSNGIIIFTVADPDGGLNVGSFVRIPIQSIVLCADLTP